MFDLTWKLFRQTGNIETYLLLKELEKEQTMNMMTTENSPQRVSSIDPANKEDG